MLDFIIYDDKKYIKLDKDIINDIVSKFNIRYNVYGINVINNNFWKIVKNNSKKIYILNIDIIDIAIIEDIRKYDVSGIMILITEKKRFDKSILNHHLMLFDYVLKNSEYASILSSDIKHLITTAFNDEVFVFKYNHVIYRLFCSDINYIEKEPASKKCVIHTTYDKFYVISSIDKLLNTLGRCFFRTHKAGIINMCNVKKIDLSNNKIIFNNEDEIYLLSNKVKKELKDYLEL